jgi:hypothetical protein
MVKKCFLIILLIYLSIDSVSATDNPFIGVWINQNEKSIKNVYTADSITVYMDGQVMWSARYTYTDKQMIWKRQSNTPFGIEEYDQVMLYVFNNENLELTNAQSGGKFIYTKETLVAQNNSQSDFSFAQGREGIHISRYNGKDKDVRIPETINGRPVVEIGDEAFRGKGLTSVTFPFTLIRIGHQAFQHNEMKSVTFPNSVIFIGDGAFSNNQLTNLILPNSLTYLGSSSFEKNQLASVTIPNSITRIQDWTFRDNLLTSLVLPNSITRIGRYSFVRNRLTDVIIPSTVDSLAADAFDSNVKITRP